MPSFGNKSLEQYRTCSVILQRVMDIVIVRQDFAILKGHRGKEEQNEAFRTGHSKLQWPNGNHNSLPSKAVDIAPYLPKYGILLGTPQQVKAIAADLGKSPAWVDGMIREHYAHLAGRMQGVADSLGYSLRWGADWDQDNDLFDNSFDDLGHFEHT